MERTTIIENIKKHSVLMCFVISLVFIVKASTLYPGGSILDQNSIGFDWTKNFLSNLFASKAINGLHNPGRIWAMIGMAFHSIAYAIFFLNASKKLASSPWAKVLKYIGIANILLIFLIATPLHDIGTFSIILTLIGLFTITFFILKSKLHILKICCILCLLLYYIFFFCYGFSYLAWAVIMQKAYNLSSILLILGLEYFTKYEDFNNLEEQK